MREVMIISAYESAGYSLTDVVFSKWLAGT